MKTKKIEPHLSSIGIDSKIISIIIFIIIAVASIFDFWIILVVPLILFFIETKSKFVKYQSVLAFIVLLIQIVITQLSQFLLFLIVLMQAWILVLLFVGIIKIAFITVYICIIYQAYRNKQIYFSFIETFVDKFHK